ncbi:MAG: M48 family metallopeptidase [Nitriliruptoraceae bacterium]|nr:M48 family metallopeptidase [Nitriliruptoraceae bacterium]
MSRDRAARPVAASRPARERRPATATWPPLEIVRSAKRRRTVSARFTGETIVVRVPAHMPPADEQDAIEAIVTRTVRRHRADRRADDAMLARRAARLADRYLDGVRPRSVTWSDRMRTRLGSCSTRSGDIRISTDLARHPDRVLDAIIVHELAHLIEPNHGPAFHALVDRYPHRQWADGYLEGFDAGRFARVVDPPSPDDEGPPGASAAHATEPS